MKKLNRKDYIYIGLSIITVLGVFLYITRGIYLFGSSLDWNSQHSVIPDYFRTLFYDSKNIFPSFAFNIGNGQNIYNLAYYGFLSPIFLIAYLLPFVPMDLYVSLISIISLIVSIILMYLFLKKKNYSSEVVFLSTICFALSTSLTFHAHRHVMFMSYMPFLLLGLFGIDKKIDKRKSSLLIISVFLLIMTSYYYSVPSLLVLGIYAIYRYLENNKKFELNKFISYLFSIGIPILIGILISSILIVPCFFAIFNSRESTTTLIDLKRLLIPTLDLSNIVYDSYGVGLTGIVIPSLIAFLNKKKENIFLFISLSILAILPLISYLLNATMYIDGKTFIPFITLYILVIAEFINNVFKYKVKTIKVFIISFISVIIYILLYPKFANIYYPLIIELILYFVTILLSKKSKLLFFISAILSSFIICLVVNNDDTLVERDKYINNYKEVKELVDKITTNDNSFYRIDNQMFKSETPNEIYGNIDYYSSNIYSSLSNQKYNKYYFDEISNNIPYRNRALTTASINILNMIHSSNKYLITNNTPLYGYEEVYSNNNIKVYKSDDVLPLGYSTTNIMSYEDYNELNPIYKEEALINNIIVGNNSNTNYSSKIKKIDIDIDDLLLSNDFKKEDNKYIINIDKKKNINIPLNEEYKDKIIFIRFIVDNDQHCNKGDRKIIINGESNKITCIDWKYYNGNKEFIYTLANKDTNSIDINIYKGYYVIKDIEAYYLDYNDIKDINKSVDSFIVDKDITKGDYIGGSIDVTNDGYFILTIPYDNGFTIKLDNKKIDYELVDNAFIGFKINKGHHDIFIEYKSPGRDLGFILSIIGILSLMGISLHEKAITLIEKRNKNEKE